MWLKSLVFALICSVLLGCSQSDSPPLENPHLGKLRHIVQWKFNEETSTAQLAEIESAIQALPELIPTILDLEWGTQVSDGTYAGDFTHVMLLTFNTQEDLDAYMAHPAHHDLGDVYVDVLEDLVVTDYWAQE